MIFIVIAHTLNVKWTLKQKINLKTYYKITMLQESGDKSRSVYVHLLSEFGVDLYTYCWCWSWNAVFKKNRQVLLLSPFSLGLDFRVWKNIFIF